MLPGSYGFWLGLVCIIAATALFVGVLALVRRGGRK